MATPVCPPFLLYSESVSETDGEYETSISPENHFSLFPLTMWMEENKV